MASAVILALAFVFAVQYYQSQKTGQTAQGTVQNSDALVRFHSPTMGNADAPVHIVEFLDPTCEACRAFYPFVKDLMATYPGKIRLTVRYAPFHQGSDQMVRVLEAARKQGKYWEALEALFAAQPDWAPQHAALVDLAWPYLNGLGLDMARLKKDMNSPEISRILEQDVTDVKTLNVTKTPEFYVNGRPLPSFGREQLQKLVKEELDKASTLNR